MAGPEVTGGVQAVVEDFSFRLLRHSPHHRIVPIQDGCSPFGGRGQGLYQFRFGLGNELDGPQPLQVGGTYVGHHPHMRAGDVGQFGDFSQSVHAHLQNDPLMAGIQIQQSQRQADLIVVASPALQGVKPLSQDRPDHLFGSRLAHTAGHANDARGEPGPPESSQTLKSFQAVLSHEAYRRPDRGLGQETLSVHYLAFGVYFPLDDGGHCPSSESIGHKVVAILAFAAQGHEEAIGTYLP